MRFPNKKICTDCKHHEYKDGGGLICNHPNIKGHSCKMMRERFDSTFQEEFYKTHMNEILCGREGKWFEPKIPK